MDFDLSATPATSRNESEKFGGGIQDLGQKLFEPAGPPDGFLLVLPYLDLESRLNVEKVSKSLREAVRGNALVWQNIYVEPPASRHVTDEILLNLVKRADGLLKSLGVESSLRISEGVLEQALALNSGLEKLAVPGCTRIDTETLVLLLESHSRRRSERNLPGIKQVHVGGLYNLTTDRLDRLYHVVQSYGKQSAQLTPPDTSPLFYGFEANRSKSLHRRSIDVAVCPFCADVRVVYDCTKHWMTEFLDIPCRACLVCIARCMECGCCNREISYDESVNNDEVCRSCWLHLPKCSECNRALTSLRAKQLHIYGDTSFTCEDCLAAHVDRLEFPAEFDI